MESRYARPPAEPVMKAVGGIRYDYNFGLRISVPKDEEKCRVVIIDLSSGLAVFSSDVEPGTMVVSRKHYYVPFRFEIWRGGRMEFSEDMDLTCRQVLVQIPGGTLGDAIAWFSQVERFCAIHQCDIVVAMDPKMAELFRMQYRYMTFVTVEEAEDLRPYATYNLGLFFGGDDTDNQPIDFRFSGLHRSAGLILGLETPVEDPPRVDLSAKRTIKEPYAVIATQSTAQCKYWNNPSGWREVIAYLKQRGLRVLCIDRNAEYGNGVVCNRIPWGCEDFTGDRPLQERIDLIKDAKLFVGLGSGLSWLAWCCRVPVVLISGFSLPNAEFHTPYRVINYHSCCGCWDDMREKFDHDDFMWCPRHKGTDRQFECTRTITAKMVIEQMEKII